MMVLGRLYLPSNTVYPSGLGDSIRLLAFDSVWCNGVSLCLRNARHENKGVAVMIYMIYIQLEDILNTDILYIS